MTTTSIQAELRNEIRNMSFGELEKLRLKGINNQPFHKALGFQNEGEMKRWLVSSSASETTTKPNDSSSSSSSSDDNNEKQQSRPTSTTIKTRTSKNQPTEHSSKVQVSRIRQVVSVPKRVVRDPRFMGYEAEGIDFDRFNGRYDFLLNENVMNDVQRLRDEVRREREARESSERKIRRKRKWSDEQLAAAQADLTRLEQLHAENERKKKLRETLRAEKEKLGVTYLNKAVKKTMELDARFEELKSKGPKRMSMFFEKKRKRVGNSARGDSRRHPASSSSSSAPPLGI